jgi:mono/diheme cytochrome c family protein
MRRPETSGLVDARWCGIWLLFSILFSLPAHADKDSARLNYKKFCAPCHGVAGRGDGPGAGSLPVRPADHTDGGVMNKHSDGYLYEVIAKGGTAVGKSAFMPPWQGQFSKEQIQDLVGYIRNLANRR